MEACSCHQPIRFDTCPPGTVQQHNWLATEFAGLNSETGAWLIWLHFAFRELRQTHSIWYQQLYLAQTVIYLFAGTFLLYSESLLFRLVSFPGIWLNHYGYVFHSPCHGYIKVRSSDYYCHSFSNWTEPSQQHNSDSAANTTFLSLPGVDSSKAGTRPSLASLAWSAPQYFVPFFKFITMHKQPTLCKA